jgi:hypothetical protein
MRCVQCGEPFAEGSRARAGISVSVMGDEYIYSYWPCAACGWYTVQSYHDRFMGDDEVTFLPPVARDVGDRCVALATACPDPFDKNCECPSHKALYYGLPDR